MALRSPRPMAGALAREAIHELYDLLRDLDRRISIFDKKVEAVFRQSEPCQRIAKIKGVSPKTATAILASIGDGPNSRMGAAVRCGPIVSRARNELGPG